VRRSAENEFRQHLVSAIYDALNAGVAIEDLEEALREVVKVALALDVAFKGMREDALR
jgi:hypothetical protein